jgi:hypothetical protein
LDNFAPETALIEETQKLIRLRMKDNQSLQSFVNYFETLQVRLKYHDKELKDLFIAKLTMPLQREIYKLGGANPPTTYTAAKELARSAENFLRNMPGQRPH